MTMLCSLVAILRARDWVASCTRVRTQSSAAGPQPALHCLLHPYHPNTQTRNEWAFGSGLRTSR